MVKRLRIIVLGYIVRGQIGGMAWYHLQYVMGLAQLGHDVYLIEDRDDYPSCYDLTSHKTEMSDLLIFPNHRDFTYLYVMANIQNVHIRCIKKYVGAGRMSTLDLAALTDDWLEEIVRQCEIEYKKTRWAEGAPTDSNEDLMQHDFL